MHNLFSLSAQKLFMVSIKLPLTSGYQLMPRSTILHYYRKHKITLFSSLPIALNSSKLQTHMLSNSNNKVHEHEHTNYSCWVSCLSLAPVRQAGEVSVPPHPSVTEKGSTGTTALALKSQKNFSSVSLKLKSKSKRDSEWSTTLMNQIQRRLSVKRAPLSPLKEVD